MERSPVQILVVVAFIHLRPMKTKVEKGSTITVFVCGSVGPKTLDNSVVSRPRIYILRVAVGQKGLRLIFRNWARRACLPGARACVGALLVCLRVRVLPGGHCLRRRRL
jgi:hypothetical protein